MLSVNSFSKAWAMTGWRIGWLTHPSGVADQLGAMTQYINSGTAGPIQAGATAAIRQGEPLVDEIRQRIRTGLDLAYEKLPQVPGIVLPSKAARRHVRLLRVRRRERRAAEPARDILEKARVGLAPGYLFGSSAQRVLAHVRLPRRRADRDSARAHARHEELTLRERAGRQQDRAG